MGPQSYILAVLLLLVIVGMLVLAWRLRQLQYREEELPVALDERLQRFDRTEAVPQHPKAEVTAAATAVDTSHSDDVAGVESGEPLCTESAEGRYAMRAPVELLLGDSPVGVREGTDTHADFRRYADAMLADLKEARADVR